MTLDSLGSYVTGTTYDAAGRITSRLLGSSGLKQAFAYTAWDTPNQGGRLDTIKAGTAPNYDNLQNLDYGYDGVGNILTILDAANSSQKQCFTYDALNRLTRGTTTNDNEIGKQCGSAQLGNGNYDQSTTYDTATGNLASKAGVSYGYNDTNHDHAVTHLGGVQKYWYDANGNQVTRIVGSDTYDLAYDAENRLVEVKKNNITIATFVYDGDGNRVRSSVNGVTAAFVGNHTEWDVATSSLTRYYYAGSTRVAMRKNNTVYYLLGDHLGSTSVTTDQNGQNPVVQLYAPWGEVRYSSGSLQTKYTYTGQYSNVGDFGLMFYNARWYDPYITQWAQPDSMVPDPYYPLDWNRYAYVRDNPFKYQDPSGHRACNSFEDCEDYGITPMGGAWADLYFSKLKDPYSKSPINMNISTEGLDFIKSQEGLYLDLYNDGNQPGEPMFYNTSGAGLGNCTIGYGHLVHTGPCNGDAREVGFNSGITNEQANKLILNDILPAENGVRKYVKVNLTQPQFDALVSLVFNWGVNNFRISPKLTMLNNGDYVDMALHLRKGPLGPNGQQYPGLVNRRESELAMFLSMVDR